MGAAQAFGGFTECAAGISTSLAGIGTGGLSTPIGLAITCHGLDNFITGFNQMYTGNIRNTATVQVLEKTGMSSTTALAVDGLLSLGGTSTLLRNAVSGGSLKAGSELSSKTGVGSQLARTPQFKSFTKSNYRYNLKELTGIDPGNLFDAHHVFPQKYRSLLRRENVNINIDDPKYLTWWEKSSYQKNAYEYNKVWRGIMYDNVSPLTTEQILQEGKRIMTEYGIKTHY